MAADVLLYNALTERNRAKRAEVTAIDTQIATLNTQCANAITTVAANKKAIINAAGARHPEFWSMIPTQPEAGGNFDSGFKVCDTSGYYRCGNSCSWTVPSGVTCARFQIWGAGAITASSCCCGFSPIGATGAYASVIMPVTAGNTYTLCGGCAYCCYAARGQTTVQSCPSYVTGSGLSNFCAEGGKAGVFCEMKVRGSCGVNACNYCIYQAGSSCICTSGSDVCMHDNQGGYTCTYYDGSGLNIIGACNTYQGTATTGDIYGIRGAYHKLAEMGGGVEICIKHAPIYGFESSSGCHCCISTPGVAGYNRSACSGYMQIPGGGGWAGFTCAGCNTHCGDAGRMGMVCVSWKS